MNEDFKYVAAIAEHGSISDAARAAHISQPGLSQRLKRLEAQMGTPLFDRASLPLTPTPAGEVYLRYAYRALAAEQHMRREVAGAASGRMQSLRVGVSAARADAILSEVLVSFYETHRGCTVELLEMSTLSQLHDLFLGGSIDCAVLTPMAPDPVLYEGEVLCRERLVVAVPEGSRFPSLRAADRNDRVWIRQLEGIPFILPSCGPYFDPLVAKALDLSAAQLDIIVRNCSAQLAIGMVQEGLGAAIAPTTSLIGRKRIKSYDLGDVDAGNHLRYIRRRDTPVHSEERLFLGILKTWLDEHAP